DHAGEATQGQRRQLANEELGDGPVEAPADRGDREEHKPSARDARGRRRRNFHLMEWPGRESAEPICPLVGFLTTRSWTSQLPSNYPLSASRRGNPPRSKNMSPVKSGRDENSHRESQFFRLANPLGLTDTWPDHRRGTDPCFPTLSTIFSI